MGQFHEIELPGEQEILKGLADLDVGVESIESLLVSIEQLNPGISCRVKASGLNDRKFLNIIEAIAKVVDFGCLPYIAAAITEGSPACSASGMWGYRKKTI